MDVNHMLRLVCILLGTIHQKTTLPALPFLSLFFCSTRPSYSLNFAKVACADFSTFSKASFKCRSLSNFFELKAAISACRLMLSSKKLSESLWVVASLSLPVSIMILESGSSSPISIRYHFLLLEGIGDLSMDGRKRAQVARLIVLKVWLWKPTQQKDRLTMVRRMSSLLRSEARGVLPAPTAMFWVQRFISFSSFYSCSAMLKALQTSSMYWERIQQSQTSKLSLSKCLPIQSRQRPCFCRIVKGSNSNILRLLLVSAISVMACSCFRLKTLLTREYLSTAWTREAVAATLTPSRPRLKREQVWLRKLRKVSALGPYKLVRQLQMGT